MIKKKAYYAIFLFSLRLTSSIGEADEEGGSGGKLASDRKVWVEK